MVKNVLVDIDTNLSKLERRDTNQGQAHVSRQRRRDLVLVRQVELVSEDSGSNGVDRVQCWCTGHGNEHFPGPENVVTLDLDGRSGESLCESAE